MRKLTGRLFILALPLILMAALYIIVDPFCVVGSYDVYRGGAMNPNRDYLSTEFLLQRRKTYSYDSFVLGNSRSLGVRSEDWVRYLPPGSNVFHYAAYSDPLMGIAEKLKLIDALGYPIRNCLVFFDYTSVRGVEDSIDPPLRKHWRLSGANPIEFHLACFRAFYGLRSLKIMQTWLPYAMLGPNRPKGLSFEPVHNDILMEHDEEQLALNEDAYYKQNEPLFAPVAAEVGWGPIIYEEKQFAYFNMMKAILDKHHTHYKIVIPPSFDQVKLNPQDVGHLKRIFGADTVWDFSGRNAMSMNMRNFYDRNHFRPTLGREILKIVYPEQRVATGRR